MLGHFDPKTALRGSVEHWLACVVEPAHPHLTPGQNIVEAVARLSSDALDYIAAIEIV
jgi:hypothetical protein